MVLAPGGKICYKTSFQTALIPKILRNFALSYELCGKTYELTRSVLLLLVEENVGNFLKDARRQAVLTHSAAAIPTSSSFGFLQPSSKVWQFSPRFLYT